MLQKISDTLKGHAWLTYGLFGALSLIFAAWGAYGIANLNFGSGANGAKVNGETLPADQMRRIWLEQQSQWQQQHGGEMPAAQKALIQDQIVESFVRSAVVTQRAHQLGYRVSDQEVMQALQNQPAFQIDGRYSPDLAKARLTQLGISADAFAVDLKNELQRDQVDRGIRLSDFMTGHERAQLAALENEERQIRYAVIPEEKYAASAVTDDAAVRAYYEAHKAEFMTIESVKLQYAQLNLDQLTSQVTITDADIRDYYDKNKTRFAQPERRRARHILVTVTKDRNDAAALARANEALAKVKAGGDFAALAKQYSDDTGSATQGGDLGFSQKSDLVGPFADALFSMSVNEIRGPVKSQFGYHVIQLEAIEAGKTKSLDEARPEIEAQLRHDRAADKFGDAQEQLQQKLEQPGTTLEGLAQQFNMQTGELATFERGTGGGDLGDSRDLQEAVFSDAVLAEHKIGGPVLLGENRLVIVKALEHHPPAAKPIAQVHDAIVAAIRKERGRAGAIQAAQAAVTKLRAGASLDEVTRELGVAAEPPRFIGRTDPSVPAQIGAEAFASGKPAAGKPAYSALELPSGGAAILSVLSVKTHEGANPEQAAASVRQALAQHSEGDADAYLEQLRLNAKVEKNPQVFDQ